MRRRGFLKSTCATGVLAVLAPSQAFAVPAVANWSKLSQKVGSRLITIQSPITLAQQGRADVAEVFRRLKNPYWVGDEPGLTQTLGWIDAWTSRPSTMAVAAENATDVAATIEFAKANRISLIVKGGGHSYFGNSNRADSLLIWTRRLRSIEVHDNFRPQGSPAEAATPAVSVGAGTLWGEVYRTVARDHGRYVQGGGCLTVGTAGFVQGGGFGSFSKQFGTGAANLIEAEVVTADGVVRIVNAWKEPELYFALRGGGGGTFGVVTRLTLRTHPLPEAFGAVIFEASAADDDAWKALVEQMLLFYREKLHNPNWGEQIRFLPNRRLSVSMLSHSLGESEIQTAWAPFFEWIASHADRVKLSRDPLIFVLPGRRLWDPDFLRKLPGLTLVDDRPAANLDNMFWATNLGEVGQVLNAYQSRWIAASWLQPSRLDKLVEALIDASRQWPVSLHTNKGLAGGSAEALSATGETATNPKVLDAFALLICAADAPPAYPGIVGHEPDVAKGRREAASVSGAMEPIVKLDSTAGSYMSEANYFEADWQQAYWGSNYARLVATKRRYDPRSVFAGHHTVQSS